MAWIVRNPNKNNHTTAEMSEKETSLVRIALWRFSIDVLIENEEHDDANTAMDMAESMGITKEEKELWTR